MSINPEFGNTTGERIRWLRNTHNLSRYELCKKLNECNPHANIAYTTVQGWEEGKIPRKNNLKTLSKLFTCSEKFLLCETNDLSYVTEALSLINMSDTKELEMYDGEPVWITKLGKNNLMIGNYALVNYDKRYFIFNDGSILPFDSITDNTKIYSKNNYSTYKTHSHLSLNKAKALSSVYIIEINATPDKSRYAGYYSYNAQTQCFEKDDHSIILKDSGYNLSYVAYEQPPTLNMIL